MPASKSDEWISTQRLADMFDVSRSTIHQWCKRQGLPHYRTPGRRRVRFDPHAVVAYCRDQGVQIPVALERLTERKNGTARATANSSSMGPGLKRRPLIIESDLPEAENF